MMQHDELIGLMKGTIPFTNKTLSHLTDAIKEYPYFQAAHLLRTLNLMQIKDSHFLLDLRKTAIYVPDRKRLFFQVEDHVFDPEVIKALDKQTLSQNSPFELIDIYLSENEESPELNAIETKTATVSSDYASYYLSEKTGSKKAPPLQNQETIDKFLEEDAVSPLKIKLNQMDEREEKHPGPISEQTTEGAGFFSETLAKIYIKQKKYSKALEIIRELNLIYPEKSRYFAEQIRFLEKLITYTKIN